MKKLLYSISFSFLFMNSIWAGDYSVKIMLDDIKSKDSSPSTHGMVNLTTVNNVYGANTSALYFSSNMQASGSIKNVPKGEINQIMLFMANYYNQLRGNIAIKVCVSGGCSTAVVDGSKTNDNSFNTFILDSSIFAKKDDTLTYTISANTISADYFRIYLYPLNEASQEMKANVSGLSTRPAYYPLLKANYK